jgi:Uma2 family endonuclease
MVQQETRVTVTDFEDFIALPENRDRNFELIDGEIVEKMPTQKHGALAALFTVELGIYLKQHPVGQLGVEVRHRVPEDQVNSFQPDVSFIKDTQTPLVERGPVPRMPDLAIEIKSPDDTYRELRKKAEYYLEHGAQLVWLVYPDNRLVEVYAREADSRILSERDTLDGGDVLPGFSLKVEAIFKG